MDGILTLFLLWAIVKVTIDQIDPYANIVWGITKAILQTIAGLVLSIAGYFLFYGPIVSLIFNT